MCRMDEKMCALAAELRMMSSEVAADWLLTRYSFERRDWGDALVLIDHITLRKIDLRKLASYYLSGNTYAHDRPYRLFAKRLGLTETLRILLAALPANPRELGLLMYHLKPLLDAAEDEDERRAASEFTAALKT